jgi:hypothetical protein
MLEMACEWNLFLDRSQHEKPSAAHSSPPRTLHPVCSTKETNQYDSSNRKLAIIVKEGTSGLGSKRPTSRTAMLRHTEILN